LKKSVKPSASTLPRGGEQTVLEFKRNALLPALAGGHARHFVRLEQKLGVSIAMRGNLVAIGGPAPARAQAADVLHALYGRLEAGHDITMADLDAELRFLQAGKATTETAGGLKTASGRVTRPRGPAQAAYIKLMEENDLVFGLGPAGTGKTYMAAAYGAHLLNQRKVERLILSRPALEAGERLGFLPGDLKEKIDPYLRPLYDALFDVLGDSCLRLMENGVIEVAPLAFMRGRTLTHAFVILDEAQNCTPSQMKMALTRLGEDSQMVVTGDPSQSDLPKGADGLNEAIRILAGVEGVGFARFTETDVVRHALVARVVAAYARAEEGGA